MCALGCIGNGSGQAGHLALGLGRSAGKVGQAEPQPAYLDIGGLAHAARDVGRCVVVEA